MLPVFFQTATLFFDFAVFLSHFVFYKKVNKYLFFLTNLIFLGGAVFILLFFRILDVYDYYLTNLLIFIALPMIVLVEMLDRNYPYLSKNIILKSVVSLRLLILIYIAAVHSRMKYEPRDPFVQKSILVDKKNQ